MIINPGLHPQGVETKTTDGLKIAVLITLHRTIMKREVQKRTNFLKFWKFVCHSEITWHLM